MRSQEASDQAGTLCRLRSRDLQLLDLAAAAGLGCTLYRVSFVWNMTVAIILSLRDPAIKVLKVGKAFRSYPCRPTICSITLPLHCSFNRSHRDEDRCRCSAAGRGCGCERTNPSVRQQDHGGWLLRPYAVATVVESRWHDQQLVQLAEPDSQTAPGAAQSLP